MHDGTVSVTENDAGDVVVSVTGALDADTARLLLVAVAAAKGNAARLRVDLREVQSVTHEGVLAVTGCRRLHDAVPSGVSFLVAGGAGSEALLASLTSAP